MDSSQCPAVNPHVQADGYTSEMTDGVPKTKYIHNLNSKMKDMESRLFDEMVKNRELNSTLSRHEHMLKLAESTLDNYKTNFSRVFRTMMYMEQKLQRQRKASRSLNDKLSNVILDVVEVNNLLTRKPASSHSKFKDKQVVVESVADVKTCQGYTGESMVFVDCEEIYAEGHTENGVYYVKPSSSACPIPVWCDMETRPGGWLTIQKRFNGNTDFNRNWDAYKRGFGDVNMEFWLGNDNIFLISNQKQYELRIDLWDFSGNRVYASYKTFKVEGERDFYKLHVHGYSGSAKDSLFKHNRMMFSTPDQDNDARREAHCAKEWEGGWWFNNCWFAFLNGPYHNQSNIQWRGIAWNHWKREQLGRSEMKIRPIANPQNPN
ncbi:hypothetical protein SNE40_012995 [Patella caerulea]|uniref:Fibrinogen C-terminal domain-containing protein n=1 Tax=Patella caerulea TaxID=87958 RepID=A0AAN8PWE3_PATCE